MRVVTRPDQLAKADAEEEGVLAPESSESSDESEEAESSAEESVSVEEAPDALDTDEPDKNLEDRAAHQVDNGIPSTSEQVCV